MRYRAFTKARSGGNYNPRWFGGHDTLLKGPNTLVRIALLTHLLFMTPVDPSEASGTGRKFVL